MISEEKKYREKLYEPQIWNTKLETLQDTQIRLTPVFLPSLLMCKELVDTDQTLGLVELWLDFP